MFAAWQFGQHRLDRGLNSPHASRVVRQLAQNVEYRVDVAFREDGFGLIGGDYLHGVRDLFPCVIDGRAIQFRGVGPGLERGQRLMQGGQG